MPEKEFHEQSFEELLALEANSEKASLVKSTLQAFREGEPSAFKLVSQALLEHKYNEENKFPITDERLIEILLFIVGAIQRGEI